MRTKRSLAAALTSGTIALGAATTFSTREAQQPGGGRAAAPATTPAPAMDTDEDGQPKVLPKLPTGMTNQMLVQGDSIFHSKGCVMCHGAEATGMPNAGSALTRGTSFIPTEWQSIDSLITAGIPEGLTRSGIAMPSREQSKLTPDEIRLVAAYVWAIGHVRDEPWPGGHRTHEAATAQAAQPAATPAGGAPKRP